MTEERRETGEVAPSMNPEERPNLQSSIEELTAHYKKEHPESF